MNTSNTRYGAEKISELLSGAKHIFFVGIGGVNMSSLAAISASLGYRVSGSDRSVSEATERLVKDGITLHIGHSADNVSDADALIYTVSVPIDNTEYVRAGELGIPRISRADYLGWLMHDCKIRIGVSGMHGKSTATGMCASVLIAADCDPTISSGAVIPELGCTYRTGASDYFLYEACEYKDAFLSFYPTTAVILNIDMDHPDYFTDIEMVKDSFSKCLARVSELAVINESDANVRAAASGAACRLVRYGTELDSDLQSKENYDYFASEIKLMPHGSDFTLERAGVPIARISLAEAGLHNVSDAVAIAAAAIENGIPVDSVKRGLESFKGAARRMEHIGKTASGADVYLDYAHHPTEIKAALSAAKCFGGRLITVFQPHTYTRTKALFAEFAEALAISDVVILADIFAAREDDIYGVSSEMLANETKKHGASVIYSGELCSDGTEFDRIAKYVTDIALTGDNVIVMGAGNINTVADKAIK